MTEQHAYSSDIKRINRNRIYRFLYKKKDLSKQDIAYALKMSLPTVTQNLLELRALDLIEETGRLASTGGRKACAISFKSGGRFAVGLDVTRNHVGIVLVDLGGTVMRNQRFRLPFADEPSYYEQIGALLGQFLDGARIDCAKILGVGIAVPGIVSDASQSLTYSPVLPFANGALASFAAFIPYPCRLCSDANAAATAELWSAGETKSLVSLALGSVVSGAVAVDGRFIKGQNGRASEFGHMTIVPDGKPCGCGQRGCLNAYCNAHVLADDAGGKLENFFVNLERGSKRHQVIWDEYLRMLALAVNQLHMIFNCDVILGGYVGLYLDDYIDRLREMAAQRSTFESDGSYLKICGYKIEAAAVGAALLYIKPFIGDV